jgi:hypothetical protein
MQAFLVSVVRCRCDAVALGYLHSLYPERAHVFPTSNKSQHMAQLWSACERLVEVLEICCDSPYGGSVKQVEQDGVRA